MSSYKIRHLKKDFGKKYKLSDEEMNNLRWHKVTTDPKYKHLLKDFNKLRKEYVQGLLDLAIYDTKCSDCLINIAGSNDLTSDYDATISSLETFGKVAEYFNDAFELYWGGVSSAEIFDTNIYATGYFTEVKDQKSIEKLPKPFKVFTNKTNGKERNFAYLKCVKGKNNCKLDNDLQTTWAFLQYVKLHKLYEITHLKNGHIKDIITIPNYKLYEQEFEKRLGEIDINNQNEMNKMYVKKIKEIETYYKKFKNSRRSIDIVKYKELIASAMFFGNETYFTQGSFFHVVGIVQMKMPNVIKIITKQELMHSIIENFSYLYMEYVEAKDAYYFIGLSAKYLMRILDAIEKINGTNGKYFDIYEALVEAKKLRRKKDHVFFDKVMLNNLLHFFGMKNNKKPIKFQVFIGFTYFFKDQLSNFPFIINTKSITKDKALHFNFSKYDDDESSILSTGDLSTGDLSTDDREQLKSIKTNIKRSSLIMEDESIIIPNKPVSFPENKRSSLFSLIRRSSKEKDGKKKDGKKIKIESKIKVGGKKKKRKRKKKLNKSRK